MFAFPAQAAACDTMQGLAGLAIAAVGIAGMTVIASGMVSGPRLAAGEVFHFHNWPPGWLALYEARGFLDRDPLPRWAIVSGAAARWSDILARLPAHDPGREIAELAGAFGLREGLVTPVRSLDGHLGLVSVGGPEPSLSDARCHYLQVVCTATLHRAEALAAGAAVRTTPSLSRRERECVALLTQGMGEREIASRLGIREVTARFHLDNARLKTGARSRTHLAAIAGQWLGRG